MLMGGVMKMDKGLLPGAGHEPLDLRPPDAAAGLATGGAGGAAAAG